MVQENSIKKPKLLIIGGPTAVGKTKLGIVLAQKFNGEIISCDSLQIYKKLDIGTAKATQEEQKLAKQHLIDIKEPNQTFSVGDYKENALNIIHNLQNNNKLPIIVGGTGMYIEALLYPYNFSSTTKDESIREKYKQLAKEKGNEFVYQKLMKIDEETAKKLHQNDLKRVIRALEIYETTGIPKSQQKNSRISDFDFKLLFLNEDRAVLYDRINKRVDKMIGQGLEQEVRTLIQQYGLTRDSQSMQAIGYSEFFDYFENKIDKQSLIEKIKQDSRNYAKRQITWFRHMENIEEVNISKIDDIIENVGRWLKDEK